MTDQLPRVPVISPKIRVLCIMSGLNPKAGGPPSSARSIWLAACRSRVSVSAAIGVKTPTPAAVTEAIQSLSNGGVTVNHFSFSRLFGDASEPWGISLHFAVWCIRAARNFDVIQAHGCWTFSTLIAVIAAKIGRRPLVLIPHETLTAFDIMKNLSPLKRFMKRRLKAFLLWACDAIVFSSALEQQDSVGGRWAGKSVVMYHPALDETAPRHPARDWSAHIDRIRVGFLGRLDPKKNLDLLIEAISEIPTASLKIAGDGPAEYTRRLHDLAQRYDLNERLEWLGFLDSRSVHRFFDSIDVLAMPSSYECFGRVAAEAMGDGLPVIVSEATGIAEIVSRNNCGIVVKPRVANIRAAIETLYNHPSSLTGYSSRSLIASDRELTMISYGIKLATLYRNLCDRDR